MVECREQETKGEQRARSLDGCATVEVFINRAPAIEICYMKLPDWHRNILNRGIGLCKEFFEQARARMNEDA